MKIYNILLITIYFIFIIILFGGAFIALWHYSKNHFISAQANKLRKCVYFLVTTGIFNFALGTVHSITYKIPKTQLFLFNFCLNYLVIIFNLHEFK
jgi:hypothetical protein